MTDQYRWTHVKTELGTGEFDGCEITTIDITKAWRWTEYAEIAALIVGLICWGYLWFPMVWVLIALMGGSIIVGVGLHRNEQVANRFLSRMFTTCELVAFLGIVLLPPVHLFYH